MNHFLVLVAFAASAIATPLLAGSAIAGDQNAFDSGTFAALQSANKPILIDVRADWCPTCRRQDLIISSLMAGPDFKGYTVLAVNFDNQPNVLRQFNVTQQSTLIVYKGKTEMGRSTGDTSQAGITALLRKASS